MLIRKYQIFSTNKRAERPLLRSVNKDAVERFEALHKQYGGLTVFKEKILRDGVKKAGRHFHFSREVASSWYNRIYGIQNHAKSQSIPNEIEDDKVIRVL